MELAIAYRVYPAISKTPARFPNDKFELTRMCVRSFRAALGGLKVKIWVLLDNCPPQYEELFRQTLQAVDFEILKLDKIGNSGTFSLQLDLLTRQVNAEHVYFAEDDYFYLPGAIERLLRFAQQNPDVDFVTPYDHPDSYYTSSRREHHLVRPWGDRYWRTASSTCLTFLAKRSALLRTESMFRTFRTSNDFSIWLALTQKLELLDPRVHLCNWFRFKGWARSWLQGGHRILLGRRYRLWVPMPCLATHMESSCLAPLIEWQAEFERAEAHDSVSLEE